VAKRDIVIKTNDGDCPAGLFTPAAGLMADGQPGIILLMDAFGPRPALAEMAERLASAGYLTLVPDLYYRLGAYPTFDAKTAFKVEDTGKRLRAMMQATTQEMTARDSKSFVAALTEHGAQGRLGVVGYCMGGARALHAAASNPERIAAAASFHGGNLASDNPDSPHLRAGEIAARVYVGTAGVDAGFPPEQAARLAAALREAEIDHIIENYVGMAHGWCVPDHTVFNAHGAERHWTRLQTFFGEALR
jgi:carboxymethylenebutenolidase